jgi:hypothetical protein
LLLFLVPGVSVCDGVTRDSDVINFVIMTGLRVESAANNNLCAVYRLPRVLYSFTRGLFRELENLEFSLDHFSLHRMCVGIPSQADGFDWRDMRLSHLEGVVVCDILPFWRELLVDL